MVTLDVDEKQMSKLVKKNDRKLAGTRKLVYCAVVAAVELVLAFVVVIKFGDKAKDIITMPYVWLNVSLLLAYPVSNTVSKFATSKLTALIDKFAGNKGGDGYED